MTISITTRNCSQYSHPEFELHFDKSLIINEDLEWYINLLEDNVKAGTIYKPDDLIQTGCMINKVVPSISENLKLQEPDLERFPIRYIDSITNTLKILRIQKEIGENLNMIGMVSFPSIFESGIICNGILSDCEATIHRMKIDDNDPHDSGWFVGCSDSSHDHNNPENLLRTSLYDIFLKVPNLIKYFALPDGTYIEIKKGIIDKLLYKDKKWKWKSNRAIRI